MSIKQPSLWSKVVSLDYWKACLSELDSTLGFSDEQLTQLAKDCESIAEMQSEAEGRHLIPNPLRAEMNELRRKHEREMATAEKNFGVMRGTFARKLGCEPHLLEVDGNSVIQNRR